MDDKKLTDSEIVKGLKEILEIMLVMGDLQKSATISKSIDLINRTKANENHYRRKAQNQREELKRLNEVVNRLQAENERLSQFGGILLHNGSELFKELQTAKAEAYKECIEKVEEIICDNTYPDFDVNHKAVNIWKAEAYKDINNLLKELVGETDASE